jgi:amino acid transporter
VDRRLDGQGVLPSLWHVLAGPPLRARDVTREQITPVEGLSALSLDALTSVAYGPEAIIAVLALAGATALHLVLPVTVVIVALLAILVFSYRQVIDAYPGGGGAYAVSRDNFGPQVSLVAAAALVVDYTLTVAVSIAAGTGALTSAFPGLARPGYPSAWPRSPSSRCSTCAALVTRHGRFCCPRWCSSSGFWPSSPSA